MEIEVVEYDENNSFQWSAAWTKLLIEKRLAMERDFTEGKRKKNILWTIILRHIKDVDPNFPFTVNEMKAKFYNLFATYKKIKKRNNSSGQSRTYWPYFDVLDDVYGNKHSISPPENNIYDSLIPCDENENEDEYSFQDLHSDTPSTSIPNKRPKKESDLVTYLKKFNEDEERRHQQFVQIENEKTEIEVQKLEVLQKLQSTLEKFVTKK